MRKTALEKYKVSPSELISTPMLTVAVLPDSSILGGPETEAQPVRDIVPG